MKKNVIVTGANGFLGRYLVEELLAQGYEIWAVVRDYHSDVSFIINSSVNLVFCDLKKIEDLEENIQARDFECFYHLAWEGGSGKARADYKLQLDNARACADAAIVAAKLGCRRFVGVGSITELMYGMYFQQDNTYPEMTACYAAGKIVAESITKCVCLEYGIDFLWGYVSNFYGIGDSTLNIVNILVKSYLSGKSPELTEGRQKVDFTYVSDVAKALVAMGKEGRSGKSYYIGYGKPRPLKDFVIQIKDMVNPGLETGLGEKKFQSMDIDFETLDIEKLYRDTGFRPKISFEEGVKLVVDWSMKNYEI